MLLVSVQLLSALCTKNDLSVELALLSVRLSIQQGRDISLIELQQRCSVTGGGGGGGGNAPSLPAPRSVKNQPLPQRPPADYELQMTP